MSGFSAKDIERYLRKEKRHLKRVAYHEVGHAVAMYVCYGNIERIEVINIAGNTPGAVHANPMNDFEYRDRILDLEDGFEFLFNELCYTIGGGLCEAIFCNKIAPKIINNERYKFPIKGMEGDMKQVRLMLRWYGIVDEKEIISFLKVAIRRLFPFFLEYEDKIKKLVRTVLNENCDFVSRLDFYNVFDQKLYRKERRKRI